MTTRVKQVQQYFAARLRGQRIGSGPGVSVRCPFHQDRTPSLSINIEKGVWKCHAGCGSGGILDFEMKFTTCDRETAKAHVAELLGDKQLFAFTREPEAVYTYHDANSIEVFQKLRYPGKRFAQRRPDGKGGYEYKLGDCRKPLYHLPEVLVANEIFICEGEKDADNVRALKLGDRDKSIHVTATTNFDGAGKWRDEYAVFFAGKKVVILPDNDELGRKHAERVALSVNPLAVGVKVVALPGLPEKGDVSDYLQTHSGTELLEEVRRTPRWCPKPQDDQVLVPAQQFLSVVPRDVDWLVEGIIERGANGFICAAPKTGKSWASCDLSISLSSGKPWMGFSIPRPVRVALISREDNPSLTGWRLRNLANGKGLSDLQHSLYINTRSQTPEFFLDNQEQWRELVDALGRRQIEFTVFDVFNVLHGADENDNTEMRRVLTLLSKIQAEVGCGIAVVHHFSKNEQGSLTQRLRGASAIAGWAEWLIAIRMADEDAKIRRMEFELKAASPPDPIHFQITTDANGARLVTTMPPMRPATRQSVASRFI